MQSRHGQFSGFHFFICILKASMLLTFFSLSGKMFQILGPRNEILSDPWHSVFIGGWWTESSFWGCSVAHSFVQKVLWQFKEKGHSLFYIFQLQGSGDFDCEQKQSYLFPTNDNCLLEYIIGKEHSCSIFILPLLARLWHIHTRDQ